MISVKVWVKWTFSGDVFSVLSIFILNKQLLHYSYTWITLNYNQQGSVPNIEKPSCLLRNKLPRILEL